MGSKQASQLSGKQRERSGVVSREEEPKGASAWWKRAERDMAIREEWGHLAMHAVVISILFYFNLL